MARRVALSTVSSDSEVSLQQRELAAFAEAQASPRVAPAAEAGDDAAMEASVASPSRDRDVSDAAASRKPSWQSPDGTSGTASSFKHQLMLPEWCGTQPSGQHNGSSLLPLITSCRGAC